MTSLECSCFLRKGILRAGQKIVKRESFRRQCESFAILFYFDCSSSSKLEKKHNKLSHSGGTKHISLYVINWCAYYYNFCLERHHNNDITTTVIYICRVAQSSPKTGFVSIWTPMCCCIDEEIWGLLTRPGCWTDMCCMCCCWPEWRWCCCCCCCCCCWTDPRDGTTSSFSLCSISSRFFTCLRSLARRFWNQILTCGINFFF